MDFLIHQQSQQNSLPQELFSDPLFFVPIFTSIQCMFSMHFVATYIAVILCMFTMLYVYSYILCCIVYTAKPVNQDTQK